MQQSRLFAWLSFRSAATRAGFIAQLASPFDDALGTGVAVALNSPRPGHLRVLAQGKALLLAGEAVLPAPQLAAGRSDLQVQALPVGDAYMGLALRATGVTADEIGEGHGGISRG